MNIGDNGVVHVITEDDKPMIVFGHIISIDNNNKTLVLEANDVDLIVKDVPFEYFKTKLSDEN